MSFIDLAKNRFSCRKFDSKPVEREKIDMILESARVAPTAVNKQPQRILVVDDRKITESLKDCTKYTFDAPLCFIICVNKNLAYNRGYDGKNSGLGTTWVMAFNPEKAKKILDLPDELEPLAILPTGYPAKDVEISPLHAKSITIDEMASYNKF